LDGILTDEYRKTTAHFEESYTPLPGLALAPFHAPSGANDKSIIELLVGLNAPSDPSAPGTMIWPNADDAIVNKPRDAASEIRIIRPPELATG